ncbi:DNA repair protein RAD51 homolog 4-like [Culicoides brevitarsis]|uniref:DNA repair protein RAD51 homolog 4-like n=1 Tax=Culicoides brevitarsis TaxID=469753 RepID=UPI00307CC240
MELKHHFLDDGCLTRLKQSGVVTINHFLTKDDKFLMNCTNLSQEHILIIKNYFNTVYEVPVEQSAYENFVRNNFSAGKMLETGIRGLDECIKGLTFGSILEIIGAPEAGKTKICNSIALNILLRYNFPCFWLDTKLDFSPVALTNEMTPRFKNQNAMAVAMKRIHVMRALSLQETIETLKYLIEKDEIDAGLLIFDSLSSILAEFVGQTYNKGQEGLKKIIELLRNLCVKKKFIAVVTDLQQKERVWDKPQMQNSENIKTVKSFLDKIATERLLMTRKEKTKNDIEAKNSNKREMYVLKSISGFVSTEAIDVSITNEGVM